MSEDYGSDYITISDEDGNEFELELLDTLEFEGKTYSVLVPADIDTMDVNDPDYGYVILENTQQDGEELFVSVDDEEELERVYQHYMQLLDQEEEDEASGGDE